jgi:HlyD family secretion protein
MATARPAVPGNPSDSAAPRRRLDRQRTFADLITQWLLPLVSLGLLGFAGWYVWKTRPVTADPPPPILPARSPYADTLAAAGVVEAQTRNIVVGSPTAGIVVEVAVAVGDEVPAGAALFRLDDRDLRAELAVRKADLDKAKTELVRLEAEPRQEQIPVQEAAVREAEALLDRDADAYKRAQETFARRVTTEEDLFAKRDAVAFAKAAVNKAQADLDLLKAGSWRYDLDVAKTTVSRAEADVARIQTELDRLVVRALVAGQVLQVNVDPGEFVAAPEKEPLLILGNVDKLHVRVDIDEYDIPRFTKSSPAVAVPRGNLQLKYPLEFVRVEPFVVPKKSLTGDNTERVDTRVLQVIYQFDPAGKPPLFVGQQVEVFIDAASTAEAAPAGS